ncbi:Cystinosin/ERS1p repeat [Kalmanozyma brasiliensis GHG001]|uniref:Uncharacterized protein n=1 Tax=Kalmanozyma brasiliensis (strain GHG001) TaxID=1365824 RepID=V5EVY9_KALBG|nr:Cystinosin/ERS1p repeat [Kalmanozyma brasiliensis GHG001]EST09670.1 Cystinosin/ERS1p repeat [Kalmanozyma brasiliensis GHG001]
MQTTLSSMWANTTLDTSIHDDDTCHIHHDPVAVYLSTFLCVGLVVSYLPQIVRIIRNKSSQGFSPWFLLLGATSSASSFLNVVALQWGIVRCCPSLPSLECAESLLGILQVGLQWIMFASVFVLFLVYYPAEQKYERAITLPDRDQQDRRVRTRARNAARKAAAGRQAPPSNSNTDDAGRLTAPANATGGLSGAPTDDTSSVGSGNSDLDSVDSHIAQNYAAAPIQAADDDSSDNDAEEEENIHDHDPEAQAHSGDHSAISLAWDASSSAFTRLVPAFRPMWKAPGSGNATVPGRQGSTSNGRGLLSNAPRGMRRIERQRRAKTNQRAVRTRKRRTEEWSLSLSLAWVVLIHFIFISAITLLLVSSLPPKSFPPPEEVSVLSSWTRAVSNRSAVAMSRPSSRLLVSRWAAFLGSSATVLAAGQYLPQIVYTARTRLVGSLSIPMMCLQVPGSAVFVYSLALQPGTDWSSLAAYVLTGVLQLVLLVLCVAWRIRQRRAGIDDYGRPLAPIAL